MADRVVGNIIVDEHTVLDLSDNPLTGMLVPGDVTLTLHRQSGSTMIAASETITWTEIGVTGRYYFSFTPLNAGMYVLWLREIDALSGLSQREFRYNVLTAGATFSPTYANAFCAESDIERWIGMGIDSTTTPNDTQATAFAEGRAAVLMSLMASWGYPVTPASVAAAGGRLEDMLREANAIGAAIDFTMAQQLAQEPSQSERVERFQTLWTAYVGGNIPGFVTKQVGYLEMEVKGNLVSLATDHIISGDTVAFTEGAAPTSLPIGITMGNLY